MNWCWTILGMVTACVLVFTVPAIASPAISATGTAVPSSDPGLRGYWEYCYEVTWSGLPHGLSHAQVVLGLPEDCDNFFSPGFFAFTDTVGSGSGMAGEENSTVYYYCMFEPFGDPSTGLDFMLMKFEPYEDYGEPSTDGSARVCFYSLGAPVWGSFTDYVGIKFAGESIMGDLDGALPGCSSRYSPAEASTWGRVKALFN